MYIENDFVCECEYIHVMSEHSANCEKIITALCDDMNFSWRCYEVSDLFRCYEVSDPLYLGVMRCQTLSI